MEWLLLTLGVLSFLFLLALGRLLLSIVRAGPSSFDEARQIQGNHSDVISGRVNPKYELSNDPRIIEGMEGGEDVRRFRKNNRLSDDYLKSVFGA